MTLFSRKKGPAPHGVPPKEGESCSSGGVHPGRRKVVLKQRPWGGDKLYLNSWGNRELVTDRGTVGQRRWGIFSSFFPSCSFYNT